MKTAILLAALALAACGGFLLARAQPAERSVSAQISIDGEVVLRSWIYEDDCADADEVWSYLNGLAFAATPEFERHAAQVDEQGAVLLGTLIPGRKESVSVVAREEDIQLSLTYGGEVVLRKLKLVRAHVPHGPDEWRVHPDVIRFAFNRRMISRWAASYLKFPERLK